MAVVLGIETSCDDTSVAVLDGTRQLSLITQNHLHEHVKYGGIVPEVASRQHMKAIGAVYRSALDSAQINPTDIDLIAATRGPGLAGSLIVGFNFARGLSTALSKPLVSVNHLEGHVYACWIGDNQHIPPSFPCVCLVVSGGHTELTVMDDDGYHRLLGRTRDDAAGEAFDKVARIMGLGFPGGPAIERYAELLGDMSAYNLPRAWLADSMDFSFSGLKTAVYRARNGLLGPTEERRIFKDGSYLDFQGLKRDSIVRMAAGFQESVVDVLTEKSAAAVKQVGAVSMVLAGGVAANTALRKSIKAKVGVPCFMPKMEHCMDNAAMIAMAGSIRWHSQMDHNLLYQDVDINPSLELGSGY